MLFQAVQQGEMELQLVGFSCKYKTDRKEQEKI